MLCTVPPCIRAGLRSKVVPLPTKMLRLSTLPQALSTRDGRLAEAEVRRTFKGYGND